MASPSKGDAFLLLLLSLPLASPLGGEESPLDRHESQLRRLETLVQSLSATVSRLESSLYHCSPPRFGAATSAVEGGGRPPAVAVTKRKPSWSERFHFAAAARLESDPTVAAALPYLDLEGVSKYFAVGDARGRTYVFSAAGDVVMELPAPPSGAAVTAMLCYLSFRRNESFLFTGHGDGSIVAHRLWKSAADGDGWLTLNLGISRPFVRGGRELDSPPVTGLEVYQIGRKRYIVASDISGRIRVFTENGSLYGTAIASSRPLAFVKQRLVFLTETGAGSLDLRSMAVRETECEGMNGSIAKSYSFDVSERSKAYGFTAGGDLIYVLLLGDSSNLKCRVRAIRRSEIDRPVAIQTIKGYLLVASVEKAFVYNISSQYHGRVGAPRPLFFTALQEIKSLLLNSPAAAAAAVNELSSGMPLIAADREKLVVLGLGDGYIGIYRSNFPVFKVESNAVVWSGPALVFLLFLISIRQFYLKKKDSLGWMPEESFDSSSASASGSLLGPGTGDRGYVDASRDAGLRELRGGGRRAPERRYASPPPPRYAGRAGIPFRTSSGNPSYRGPADLKYRGQNLETTGLPKRREPLFSNGQITGDHVD
ncbi:putative membrane protein [Cocos nucifera]|uniref:Putative membrane protein n=1 Tax=Cocos nucifera TaxID=13894 RepID=A0A8K0N8T4_COCNU|nr:putative membrane protein [Cocos nucifera]